MRVGSLVKCIKGFPKSKEIGYNVPEIALIYTVREVAKYTGGFGILLEEVVNGKERLWDVVKLVYGEIAWHMENFVEIQPPMKIDIQSIIEQPIECV